MGGGFEDLKNDIGGGLVVPGDEGYEDAIKRWSAACEKQAGAVVFPTSAQEVSKAILFANAHSIPFTVCGGGHATSGTSSIGPEGMVLDLRRMRAVSVDPAAQTVTFDGGCLWRDVDEAAGAHGLATPGGTVSHTGVGGLILGGGFGYLSGRHGLTVDCLLEVEMVLADGRVVVASEAEEPDLFWAARGAGQSFGVATRFTSRVFPQGDVWCGMAVFPHQRLGEIVAAANEVLARGGGDQALLVSSGFAPALGPPGSTERHRVILAQMFHNGQAAEAEGRFFAPILQLGPMLNTARTMPYAKCNQLMDDVLLHGGRWLQGGANVVGPVKEEVVRTAADRLYAFADGMLEKGFDVRDSMVAYELFPFDKTCSVAPGATAHANRGRYYNVGVVMSWRDAGVDEEVRTFKRALEREITERGFKGDEAGHDGVGHYGNYLESSITAEAMFGGNARRLRELKGRYDPENRFNKLWRLL